MVLIQPGHDPVSGPLGTGGGDPAFSNAAPAVDLTGAVVYGHQLAQQAHRVPLGTLGAGDVWLFMVVIGVELLAAFGVGGDTWSGPQCRQ